MARTLSAEDYQELGKTYYKRKQYQQAIEAFTQGIDTAVIPSVALYDYRAASYEKLANFNAAVKDGREAIRLNKKDVKGYLRTGSVLQKMNKLDTALNIYKYGMKNVSVEHKDFPLLQQLHDRLTRKLSPAKAVDPFTVLPFELVEMILSYFSFRNIVNCLRVSKGWMNYLIRRPSLWTDLDLTGATKPVPRTFIRNAVRRSENGVKRVIVYRFQHTDVLRNIATACKSLQELHILSLPLLLADTLIEVAQCAQNLKTFIIHADVSSDTAIQILRRRPTLEHVEFTSIISMEHNSEWIGSFPHLHTVRLSRPKNTVFGQSTFVESLVQRAPRLQSLTLNNWSGLDQHLPNIEAFFHTSLTNLVLQDISLNIFPPLPATLKRFFLRPAQMRPLHDLDANHPSFLNAARSYLPNLTHLTLQEMEWSNPQLLNILLDYHEDEDGMVKPVEPGKQENLQHLSLSGDMEPWGSLFAPNDGLIKSTRILSPSLTSLSLSKMAVDDDNIETLLTHPTSLQTIDLSMTNITGAAIRMLADGLPNLRTLTANNCFKIVGRNAITYAEEKGVKVNCIHSANNGSVNGRRVRY